MRDFVELDLSVTLDEEDTDQALSGWVDLRAHDRLEVEVAAPGLGALETITLSAIARTTATFYPFVGSQGDFTNDAGLGLVMIGATVWENPS